jgi:hypothetical protein
LQEGIAMKYPFVAHELIPIVSAKVGSEILGACISGAIDGLLLPMLEGFFKHQIPHPMPQPQAATLELGLGPVVGLGDVITGG